MSTIKADTLSNLAGTQTVPVSTVAQGSAKAWVNFNGTGTVAIRASFNVSSITDGGTGVYTVNFTNALVDANYAPLAETISFAFNQSTGIDTLTTTSMRLVTGQSGSAFDPTLVYVAIFR
jgi:hypothetical protein